MMNWTRRLLRRHTVRLKKCPRGNAVGAIGCIVISGGLTNWKSLVAGLRLPGKSEGEQAIAEIRRTMHDLDVTRAQRSRLHASEPVRPTSLPMYRDLRIGFASRTFIKSGEFAKRTHCEGRLELSAALAL